MKLKRLFNGKNTDAGTEISGSFGGQASGESLLDNSDNKKEDGDWDEWSLTEKGDDVERGRSNGSSGTRRSKSERPSTRLRSKSEVNKRLKRLEENFGTTKVKKKKGSKSVGGTFKGKSSDVRSRIDKLALARSGSESRIKQSGFDAIFDQSSFASKPVKKLRGGRRKSITTDNENTGSEENEPARRSRSTSARRRSSSVLSSSKKKRSNSTKPRSSSKMRSSSKLRSSSKPRRAKDSTDVQDDKHSVSTPTTKDSGKDSGKKKKKKKSERDKKKRSKDGKDDSSEVSIPSKVELNNDCGSQGSITINDPSQEKKKKVKDKEKPKKPKQPKSKTSFPEYPEDDFGDGLEGLAEEFRRSKERYNEDKMEQGVSEYSSNEVPNSKNTRGEKTTNMFENAWAGAEQSNNEMQRSNPDAGDNMLRRAVDYEVKDSETTEQQEEILKLQQQLSTALQKQLSMSEEHIKEKNEFINISRELERVRVELMESQKERHEVMEELNERDRIIEEDRNRIDNLEQAIDKQLGKEEELVKNVQQSEEEIEKLLEEIQKFEQKLDNGDKSGGGASFVELRNVKKALTEREEEVASQKLNIEKLEKDLKDSMTVPQLQIDELDQENKALQGRLKGERLEYTSKLSAKDDIISSLRTELASYSASSDAQNLQSARQKLMEAREDATTVREDLAATKKIVEELQGEREDFMEEFNLLKDNNVFMEKTVKDLTEKADGLAKKVLEWTEKTYDWKQRAETAERKIKEANDDKEKVASEMGDTDASGDFVEEAPQGMFLQAAMDKGKKAAGTWKIFKNAPENQELSAEELRIRVLEEQNQEYESKIAQLSSDIVKMQTGHKEELYATKKRIATLEGENEALVLQNSTLQQLSEA